MVKIINEKTRSDDSDALQMSQRSIAFRASTADDSAMTIDAVLSTEDPVRMCDYDAWEMMEEVLLADGRQRADYLPMLDSHNRWSVEEVLGHMDNIRTEGGNTVVTCHFDKNDETAVKVFRKYRDGHARGLSVGYTVKKYMDIAPGQSAVVKGRTFTASGTIKKRIVTEWVAKEGSLVAVGADAKALTRAAAGVRGLSAEMSEDQFAAVKAIREQSLNGGVQERSAAQIDEVPAKVETQDSERTIEASVETLQAVAQTPSVVINIHNDGNRTEVELPKENKAVEAAAEPEESRTAQGATTEESALDSVNQSVPAVVGGNNERNGAMSTEKTAEQTAADVEKVRAEAVKEGIRLERERQDKIRALAGDDVSPECLEKCLADPDMTVDGARDAFLSDIRAQRAAASKPASSDNPKPLELSHNKRSAPSIDVLTAAVTLRMGGEAAVRHLQTVDYNQTTGKLRMNRRSMHVTDEMRKQHERNVNDAYAFEARSAADICEMALRASNIEVPHEREDIISRSLSTPTISTIYTQTMGAVLASSIGETVDSTVGWCKEVDVPNFKSNELHQFEGGILTKRNRGEQARPASFADTMETFKVSEYASVLNIDRQDLIDDDLNAFLTALSEYARGVQDLRPSLVYGFMAANAALSTDSVALFHSSHSNLITSSALAAATLQTGITALASQRGPGGLNLNLRDIYLVTSETLSFTAAQLVGSAEIREAAAANGTMNPLASRGIKLARDSRLNIGFTYPATGLAVAGAGTTWYLAAAGGAYGINVGYLRGTNRMPTMSTTVYNGGGKYGMAMDVQFDIGVGVQSYQGLLKATA